MRYQIKLCAVLLLLTIGVAGQSIKSRGKGHTHPTTPVTDRYLSVPEGSFPTTVVNTPSLDRTFGLFYNTIANNTFEGGTTSKPSVEYSHLSAFNSDSTRVWLNNGGGVFVADFSPSTLLVSNWQRVSNFRAESFYFTNDPDVGCSVDMTTQTKIVCRNFSTNTTTVLKDFAGLIDLGALKQMSVSEDTDDVYAFTYNDGTQEKDCLVWKRSTDTMFIDRLAGDPDLNECHVNDNGEWLVLYGYNSKAKVVDLTTGIPYDMGSMWPDNAGTAGIGGHSDIGRDCAVGTDLDGLNIYRSCWADLRTSIEAFRQRSVMLYRATSYSQGMHISQRGGRWALASFYDVSTLFPWEVTTNELVLIDSLVPFQLKRVQKGRGYRGTGAWDYTEVYKASISRDGRFIAFTTNNKMTGRTFVMVTKVGE